jgi:hypothetical protein
MPITYERRFIVYRTGRMASEPEVTMDEWRFYHDLHGEWQWAQLGPDGATVKESARGSESLDRCLADAQLNGMQPAHIVRFPGRVRRKVEAAPRIKLPQAS